MTVDQEFRFDEATVPLDSVPSDVAEHPCEKCGRETGWTGRGRRKRFCDDCRPSRKTTGVRVTGNAHNKAAAAAQTLVQLNAVIAMGAAAMRLFGTAGAIGSYQETFQEQAYQALIVDPGLCDLILRTGAKSGKLTLGLAYVGMGVAVAPTITEELRQQKLERDRRKWEADNAAGT